MTAIREYEKSEYSLDRRLPSLARRFPSLDGAKGIAPWDAVQLHQWITELKKDAPAYHSGLLLLNLAGYRSCESFDVFKAARVWGDEDRQMFINLMRIWKF